MQGNIAAGYNYPYQEPGPATVAIAETMQQVSSAECCQQHISLPEVDRSSAVRAGLLTCKQCMHADTQCIQTPSAFVFEAYNCVSINCSAHALLVPWLTGASSRCDSAAATSKLCWAMQVDFPALLAEVNTACRAWRKPTLLLFGPNDPFIDLKTVFAFLDDKRTNFEMAPTSTRVLSYNWLHHRRTLLILLPCLW